MQRGLGGSPHERLPWFPPLALCIKTMYLNGMGFRAIERVTGVHHTTIIGWVKKVSLRLKDVCFTEEIPEIPEIDELQTFVKKNQIWV
ncbi:hypothetical protein [Moorena bouillonii]|uniref:Transposase n=1 Tax=Moorena bouillonii PNG TaxID=568701 RepID=A0A1U7N2A1_9CYAN|nr:hypothetical protein [Moorena bouillonii]OLT60078.1 hypothetical protein BJP37_14625 [Moorena bouillonii PNG]